MPAIFVAVKFSEIKIAEKIAVNTGIRFEKTLVRLTPSSFTAIVKKIKASDEAKNESCSNDEISSKLGFTVKK